MSRNSGTAPSGPKACRISGTPTNTVLAWPEAKPWITASAWLRPKTRCAVTMPMAKTMKAPVK